MVWGAPAGIPGKPPLFEPQFPRICSDRAGSPNLSLASFSVPTPMLNGEQALNREQRGRTRREQSMPLSCPSSLLLQAASSPNREPSGHWCWDPVARRWRVLSSGREPAGASKDVQTLKCPTPFVPQASAPRRHHGGWEKGSVVGRRGQEGPGLWTLGWGMDRARLNSRLCPRWGV